TACAGPARTRRFRYHRTTVGAQREGSRGVISFDIGYSGQRLSLDDTVLAHFDRHRQTRFWHREAGGLLFSRLTLPTIDVCAITGPRRSDLRSRYSYWPDERAERRHRPPLAANDYDDRSARALPVHPSMRTPPT